MFTRRVAGSTGTSSRPKATSVSPYPVAGYPHLTTDRPQGTNLQAGQVDVSQVSPVLLAALERVGERLGVTIDVFSGYRTSAYSQQVGGFAGDPHSRGVAVDASIAGRPIGSYPGAVGILHSLGLRSGATDFTYQGQPDPSHVDLGRTVSPVAPATADFTPFQTPQQEAAYIAQRAKAIGLDPRAVLAVASVEGVTLPARVGDSGTSFGPFQLHVGGRLPAAVAAKGNEFAQAWANSREGIDYALQGMAPLAGGQTGPKAVRTIVYGFEQPTDRAGETAHAVAAYQAGAGPAIGGGNPFSAADALSYDLGNVPGAGAVGSAAGGVLDTIESVPKLIRFLTSWRFAEVVGGFVLLVVGLLLLGRSLGMQTPRTPAEGLSQAAQDTFAGGAGEVAHAESQPTSRRVTNMRRRTRSVRLPADEPAPRRAAAGASPDEIPF